MNAHNTFEPVCKSGCPATLLLVSYRRSTFEEISLDPLVYAR
jgi:hypothetical protein